MLYRPLVELALDLIDAGQSGFQTVENIEPTLRGSTMPPLNQHAHQVYRYFLAPTLIFVHVNRGRQS